MTAALSHSDATSKSAMVITKATAGSLSIPLMVIVVLQQALSLPKAVPCVCAVSIDHYMHLYMSPFYCDTFDGRE
jgi:hypothetical protein